MVRLPEEVIVFVDHAVSAVATENGFGLAFESEYHLADESARATRCGRSTDVMVGNYIIMSMKTAKRLRDTGYLNICTRCHCVV